MALAQRRRDFGGGDPRSRMWSPTTRRSSSGAEHAFSSRARHTNPVNAAAYAVSWPQVLRFIGDTVLGS
ncbi:hypothetical protein ACFWCF_15550 [Rhodococcus sp. NPDC060090]|uniref:hypothetical protein n=1 Tax=Rhodococcus sp. NPDC060090 TaxID=3347056 RepID=UPI003657F207